MLHLTALLFAVAAAEPVDRVALDVSISTVVAATGATDEDDTFLDSFRSPDFGEIGIREVRIEPRRANGRCCLNLVADFEIRPVAENWTVRFWYLSQHGVFGPVKVHGTATGAVTGTATWNRVGTPCGCSEIVVTYSADQTDAQDEAIRLTLDLFRLRMCRP